jgi:hypothetical protein
MRGAMAAPTATPGRIARLSTTDLLEVPAGGVSAVGRLGGDQDRLRGARRRRSWPARKISCTAPRHAAIELFRVAKKYA